MAIYRAFATIDSYVRGVPGSAKDSNFGASTYLRLGAQVPGGSKVSLDRPIGNFDVSVLAGRTISSAKLVRRITTSSSGGANAKLSRCTRPAGWVEDECTWNDYADALPWTDGGGDVDDVGPPAAVTFAMSSSGGDHEIAGLEAFVTDALDNRSGIVSMILRLVDEDPDSSTYELFSSKDNGANVWRLVIDYVEPLIADRRDRGRTPGRRPRRPAAALRPHAGRRPSKPSLP